MSWIALMALICSGPPIDDDPNPLRMSKALACKSVQGFESYVELTDAALTADDKLLVYYEPSGFATKPDRDEHIARFSQRGKIRRKGTTAVVWSKPDLLDYTARGPSPPDRVYLMNTIALKGLKPGDYELEIQLKDELGSNSATQTLAFKIVTAKLPPPG